MIKLYTKTVCPKCLFIKHTLTSKNIEFETVNIDENEEAKDKVINAGFMAVPILEIDDKLIGDFSEIQKAISELK